MAYPANTVDSDSVAQDQIRAFVERIEDLRAQRRAEHDAWFGAVPRSHRRFEPPYPCGHRLPRAATGNGVALGAAEFWLDLCARLCRDADDFDHDTRRGWVIACRLLGLSWYHRELALGDVYNYSAAEAAAHWARFLSPPDERYVGFVYTAEVVGQPDFVKVGFSTKPEQRKKQLSRIEGREVMLTSVRPGTMLHEWCIHQHGRFPIKGRPEWYRREGLPAWLVEQHQAEAA